MRSFSPGFLSEEVGVQRRLHKRIHSQKFPQTNSQQWFLCGFGSQMVFLKEVFSKQVFENVQFVFLLQGLLNNNPSRWIQNQRLLSITFSFLHMFYLNNVKGVVSTRCPQNKSRVNLYSIKWLVQGGALKLCHQIIRYQKPLLSTNIWLKWFFLHKKVTMCVVFSG